MTNLRPIIQAMTTMMTLGLTFGMASPVMLQSHPRGIVASHYVQNLQLRKCPKCGASLYAAGTWNMPKGQTFFKKYLYCGSCDTYFSVTVKEASREEAMSAGYSIALQEDRL